MNLTSQRRMAADLLDVGQNRVWIDPQATDEVEQAVTRQDLRELIDEGIIQREESEGQSRGRARRRKEKRDKRRGTGQGKRKGKKGGRNPKKRKWVNRIRAQRALLKELRDDGDLEPSVYREFYDRAGGGEYPDVHHLELALREAGHLEEEA